MTILRLRLISNSLIKQVGVDDDVVAVFLQLFLKHLEDRFINHFVGVSQSFRDDVHYKRKLLTEAVDL